MPLLSTTRRVATLAPPLPVENAVLSRAGVVYRQGQFSLLAAAPGVGKTLFANNLLARTRVPSVYFSADSDEWTARTRLCSILTGRTLEQVDKDLEQESWQEWYAERLRSVDHIDWCFKTDIDLDFIALRLRAHAEIYGDYPRLVVVDNLGNTVDGADEGAELKAACRELQAMARQMKAHVLGLCHVVGEKENGDKPIDLGDLLNKIGKIPEIVLGLSRIGPRETCTELCLTVPKNRGGKAGTQSQLPIDYTTATVGGFRLQNGAAA